MIDDLITEARNPASENLDSLSTLELVQLMNAEDEKVASAVALEQTMIARAVDEIALALSDGGRLIYMGAGTSGRLGVLDAVECLPTFNAPPGMIVGLIAGGDKGMLRAVEGAEDSELMAKEDLQKLSLSNKDIVFGIAASGRTPYVLGGLAYARDIGALRIGLSCNKNAALKSLVDIAILPIVGPEVLSGSTRLKAGTATKMVLNIISTAAMVSIGKTYGNLMVDMLATNGKLIERAAGIIQQITKATPEASAKLLKLANGELKTAIVMAKLGDTPEVARIRLAQAAGRLRQVLLEGK